MVIGLVNSVGSLHFAAIYFEAGFCGLVFGIYAAVVISVGCCVVLFGLIDFAIWLVIAWGVVARGFCCLCRWLDLVGLMVWRCFFLVGGLLVFAWGGCFARCLDVCLQVGMINFVCKLMIGL